MTVTVRIGGGFGNQLFQWAFGRNLALERGLDVVYETGFYEDSDTQGFAHHKLWLERIGLDVRTIALGKLRFQTLRRLHQMPHAVQRLLTGYAFVREPRAFSPYQGPTDHVLINGVWAHPGYFAPSAAAIRREVRAAIGEPMAPGVADGLVPVAFHVRRGDFVGHHAMVNLDYQSYLDRARSRLREVLGPAVRLQFVVFSDDVAWCRRELAADDVQFSTGTSMIEDFRMMLACRHMVMSNSTFSWWAAYLNPHGEAAAMAVIVPRRWLAGQTVEDLGLRLDGWHEIDDATC